SVYNATPNGVEGGIWQSGTGLAADDQANIYTATGNGTFDTSGTVVDFGDSIIKLSGKSGGLLLTDYFTPYDQNNLNINDGDLDSGGVLLLPDQLGANPHLMVQGGKEGTIYLVSRDQMTAGNQHYCSGCNSDPEIVLELQEAIGGLWSTPAYWNGNVYFWGVGDNLRQYTVNNGRLSTSPVFTSTVNLGFPGASPAVSANGATNAIVWAIDSTQYGFPDQANPGPAVLHAFDATNVGNELYNSTMAAGNRDTAGSAVKFSVPTIANGKVYIGTQTELDVYGP
ncbi:MAG TPA: hypothetical protein VJW51_13935, partial [Candidatus Acidoferrales bacterium]|nr:hypothetical protein [Candidatus Acidoferrales bacterium]